MVQNVMSETCTLLFPQFDSATLACVVGPPRGTRFLQHTSQLFAVMSPAKMLLVISVLILVNSLRRFRAFYLGGSHPVAFSPNDVVEVYADSLTSTRTQIPLRYSDLPLCKSQQQIPQTFSESLTGHQRELIFRLSFGQEEQRRTLCVKEYTAEEVEVLQGLVKDQYQVHWIIDDLPAGSSGAVTFEGFQLGETNSRHVYNHIDIDVLFQRNPDGTMSIVGFRVRERRFLLLE